MKQKQKTPGHSEQHNIFFPLTVALVGLFAFTVMAVTAASLGDPNSPINAFLANRMVTILTCEAGGILVTGVVAMTIDRRRTLRQRKTGTADPAVDNSKQTEEPLS